MRQYDIEIKWGVSRGRDTYGYTICSLYANGKLRARCNGGGYDLRGTVLGSFIESEFRAELLKLKTEFYGLTFHDPNFDPGKVIPPGETETVEEREAKTASITSLGLERYQAFHSASSKIPTKNHVVPLLDGACGESSVCRVLEAISGELKCLKIGKGRSPDFYELSMPDAR